MNRPRRDTLLATLALLAVTACWGSTFFLIKDLLDSVPVSDFLAVRFAMATVAMFLIFPKAVGALSAQTRKRAVVLGSLYGAGQILQTVGLSHISASVSGFITGMYVVCTPLLAALLLKNRIGLPTWGAVALAAVGLRLLTDTGISAGFGEAITLVAAVIYALHIVGLGAWSTPAEAMGLTIIQLAVISVICFVGAVPGGIVLPATPTDWASLVYMALVAGAAAMACQTWAQAHLPPTRSAVIMSMEPVFAALFAVVLGGEDLTSNMLLGGGLMLAAMLIVEVLPRRKIEAEVPHIAV